MYKELKSFIVAYASDDTNRTRTDAPTAEVAVISEGAPRSEATKKKENQREV